jgi:hypothetical protein
MMDMGLIFLNLVQSVINSVGTAEDVMSRLSVIPVQPSRGVK